MMTLSEDKENRWLELLEDKEERDKEEFERRAVHNEKRSLALARSVEREEYVFEKQTSFFENQMVAFENQSSFQAKSIFYQKVWLSASIIEAVAVVLILLSILAW